MFKKLKEKITEEVKSSPQRFQQLTQSVSDRLQSASTSDENFFSIGDDDTPAMTTSYEPGFTSVALTSPTERNFRRNSNSSIASDVSFLPKYESVANMYHLQSDLEISASEMEDNASSSSQLGHLSKEQIYSAFQKSQMRYHKYRGRYTDLAKHYKDLEKENSKIKSVLVETQDKAIRRVTELKEQCNLEQKAKAHLEAALRDDIDEKEFKIQSLQTKIDLLQNSGGFNQDGENLANLNKYLTDARQEIETLNERIQEMKANGIIFQSKEHEYKTKISGLEKEISLVSEREKENNLCLAQNKMDLHNELVIKDNEISNLKQDNEALRKSLEATTTGSTKLENLQTQNKKLIDKVDTMTSKCNNYESELLKMEQYKAELQNLNSVNSGLNGQIRDLEIKLETVREDAKKGLLSLEVKVEEKLRKEYEEKNNEAVEHFKNKLEELSGGEKDLKEMQLNLMEKDAEIKKLEEAYQKICVDLNTEVAKYHDLESNHLELIEDSVGLRSKIGGLEKEAATLQTNGDVAELKLTQLRSYVTGLEKEIDHYKNVEREKDRLMREAQARQEENDMRKSDQMEEEMKKLLDIIDEKQRRCEELEQQQEDARSKLEKLVQDFETSENAVTNLNEEARKRDEEVATLQEDVQNYAQRLASSGEEIKKLEDIRSRLKKVEAEKTNLVQEVEELRRIEDTNACLASTIRTLEEEISNLTDYNQRLDNGKLKELGRQLEEKNAKVKIHEQMISQLSEKLKVVNDSLQKKDEEIFILREHSSKDLVHLNEELAAVKDSLQKKDEEIFNLTEHSSDLGRVNEELAAVKASLQEKDEEILNLAKQSSGDLGRVSEELAAVKNLLQKKDEEIINLTQNSSKDLGHLNEELAAVKVSLQKKDEEIFNLSEHSSKDLGRLNEELEAVKNLLQKKDEEIFNSSKDLGHLNEELAAVKDLLQKKDEEIVNLTDHSSKDLAEVRKKEESERNKLLEEMESLIRENRGLRIHETELKKLEVDLTEEIKKLMSQMERYVQIEEESSRKNQDHEKASKLKDQQIEILSKRLEDCNDLIKERNKGIVTIFNNFLIENPINFVSNGEQKQLQSVEEKLQNFEKVYSVEKENLAKILTCLKQFETDYLSMSSERSQLRSEKQQLVEENATLRDQIREIGATRGLGEEMEEELIQLREKNGELVEVERRNIENISELEARNTQVVLDSNYLSEENTGLVTEVEELKLRCEEINSKYNNSELVINELRVKLAQFEDELTNSNNKLNEVSLLERRVSEVQHEKQLLERELEGLKTVPVAADSASPDEVDKYEKEIEMLKTKVVQYKSLDLTNRSSIEFYENELQKLKNQNEKINRKLDETLVTLNHCSELSNSTEIEYLKNVLYNYMLGKESVVLARVIAAVCKFDPHQTEVVLAKEQQKQTLLGQLGIL